MKATTLFRIAAAILLLFAAGHTFGFLSFRPHTPEGLAVMNAMDSVHFQEGRYTFSYGNFYRGFGLFISVFLLFSAFLAWHLGWVVRTAPQAIGAIGWIFCAVQIAGIPLDLLYFSVVQATFSATVAICLGWAAAAVPATPPA